MARDCYACEMARDEAPVRERLIRSGGWRVALDFNSSLEGWLIVTPIRHVESLAELTNEEAARLGALLRQGSIALQTVTGCVKTYAMLFAEAEGFAHLHFHLVPRSADLRADRRGPAIFGYLRETPVTEARRDELAFALRKAWPDEDLVEQAI